MPRMLSSQEKFLFVCYLFLLCCSGKRNILQIPSSLAYLVCKSIIKGLDIVACRRILKLITSQFESQFKGDSTATHYVELAVLLNTYDHSTSVICSSPKNRTTAIIPWTMHLSFELESWAIRTRRP